MTSQAQAADPLPRVLGLAFLGFPLHAGKKPSDRRAAHLSNIEVPMLFLQGTRDTLADLTPLRPIIQSLGPKTTLIEIEGGDHSFRVPVRSRKTDADAMSKLVNAAAAWLKVVINQKVHGH
jgi:predicted alpha/beta-hydrolase family hydrolase